MTLDDYLSYLDGSILMSEHLVSKASMFDDKEAYNVLSGGLEAFKLAKDRAMKIEPSRTGLLDRNGVELKRSDVFRYTQHRGYKLQSFTGIVLYIKEYACFGYKYDIDSFFREIPFTNHHELKEDFLNHIEVIG